MTPQQFHERILRPGLAEMQALGGPRETPQAARFLLAVALQESGLRYRYQVLAKDIRPGPARGWWQFEAAGGVAGVMKHKASAALCEKLCGYHEIRHARDAIWRALEGHDMMATAMARLLLLTDPYAIPSTREGGWSCYAHRLWRPGKPHPASWPGHWATASEVSGLPA